MKQETKQEKHCIYRIYCDNEYGSSFEYFQFMNKNHEPILYAHTLNQSFNLKYDLNYIRSNIMALQSKEKAIKVLKKSKQKLLDLGYDFNEFKIDTLQNIIKIILKEIENYNLLNEIIK